MNEKTIVKTGLYFQCEDGLLISLDKVLCIKTGIWTDYRVCFLQHGGGWVSEKISYRDYERLIDALSQKEMIIGGVIRRRD